MRFKLFSSKLFTFLSLLLVKFREQYLYYIFACFSLSPRAASCALLSTTYFGQSPPLATVPMGPRRVRLPYSSRQGIQLSNFKSLHIPPFVKGKKKRFRPGVISFFLSKSYSVFSVCPPYYGKGKTEITFERNNKNYSEKSR